MRLKSLSASVVALGVLSIALSADAPARQGSGPPPPVPQAQAKPAAPQAQSNQRPIFRVNIDLVTTDVIVRDGKGVFVTDLKKDEFEVYEDGVKQDVVSIQLVHGGRVYTQVAAPPPPVEEGIILPPSRPTNDAAGRIFVLFVDDLHLDFRNTGRIRELFKKISKTLIHDGDMFGIVSTGPASISIDLTYDHKRLDEAINKITGSGLKPNDIVGQPEGQEGVAEVRYRAHVAFATASDLMRTLENVHNRRKSMIYVSEGYDFNPFPASRDAADPLAQAQQAQQQQDQNANGQVTDPTKSSRVFADADLVRELAQLTRDANRANVTMYTIDPRGLVAGMDLDQNIDPVEWMDYLKKSTDSLRILAEQTGGMAVVNQNDFDSALRRIDSETSDYYMLGYYSKNPDPTVRTRSLEVKVTRKDLNVWSRKMYAVKQPRK
jgi:VWFA-related protein